MTATGNRLLAAALLVVAVIASGVFWLLGTAGGARLLIAAASLGAPFRIDAARVSGRLAGDLRLGSVDVRWLSGEASVESLHLRWRPLALFGGTVAIAAFSVDGATVILHPEEREEAPSARFEPRWPSVTGLPARLAGRIDSLRLSRLEIRRPGREPAVVAEATAQVIWKDGVLSVSGLTVASPSGGISGSLAAGFVRPSLRAELAFRDVDLAPLVGAGTEISGTLRGEGTPQDYAGEFSLKNRGEGVRSLGLSGAFAGDLRGIALPRIEAAWLDGVVEGKAEASWTDGISARGSLAGRALNPARIRPDWPGRINFEIKGSVRAAEGSPVAAEVDGRLLSSTLRRRPLTGEIHARLDGEDLGIARLELHGDVFDVTAGGRLRERIDVSADIRRVGGLWPDAEGSARAKGWIRRRDGSLEGSLSADAKKLRVSALRLDSFSLEAAGTSPKHSARLHVRSRTGEAEVSARGGYRAGVWEGTVTRLSMREKEIGDWTLAAPFSVAASSGMARVSPLLMTGPGGGRVSASADLATGPLRGTARGEWKKLDPGIVNPWLKEIRVSGSSSGSVEFQLMADRRLNITGDAELSGKLAHSTFALDIPRARAALHGNERGMRASLELALGRGGTITGSFRSDRPARAGIPEGGKVRLAFASVDLAPASPFLPEGLHAEGVLDGRAEGEWLNAGKFVVDGEVRIASGRLRWETKGGEAAATLRSAALRFSWRDEAASGEIALALEEYGSARGTFRIPLRAQLPPAIRTDGQVQAAFSAKLREKGLLPAFLPGALQESSGEIDMAVTVGGTWGSPALEGKATLSRAAAYLPAAGIRLEEIELRAVLAGTAIRVETFKVRSGAGSLTGSATVHLENWRIARYDAAVAGKDFLTLDLPEVRLLTSPDLSVEGTTRRLKVRGVIRVPEMEVRGRQRPPPVPRTGDVIIIDAKEPSRKTPPLSLDVSVKVVLEKHVLVKAQGVDARLEGGLTLHSDEKERMIARGEIRVAQGSYAVRGIRLTITRGSLLFAGTPLDRPTLDVRAVRTVGEVKAGVEVAGTLQRPIVKLYSEPPLDDTDILSYIVLGHPLGQQKEQAEPLMLAASALLPFGQSATLQDRLKRRFGFDVLEVKSAGGEAAGSVVTIGKYLNPRLYLSYGRSIFTGTNEYGVRYEFRKRWQLESKFGEEGGVDLFYKIEFR